MYNTYMQIHGLLVFPVRFDRSGCPGSAVTESGLCTLDWPGASAFLNGADCLLVGCLVCDCITSKVLAAMEQVPDKYLGRIIPVEDMFGFRCPGSDRPCPETKHQNPSGKDQHHSQLHRRFMRLWIRGSRDV